MKMGWESILLGQLIFLWMCLYPSKAQYPILRQVNIITRHGARSPTQPFPLDEHQAEWEELGFGQLTTLGMQQMYQLGQVVRDRYDGFIDTQYSRYQIVVRSTDHDRAMESGQTMLSAMFPPTEDQIWNPDINWQPIPIHAVPLEQDPLLNMDTTDCPRYDQLLEETRQTDWYKAQNASYEELYEYMKNYSGLNKDFDPVIAWDVWDTLYCNSNHNKSLPEWVTDEIMTKVPQEIIPFEYQVEFGSPEKSKLRGGPLIDEIITHTEAMINNETDPRLKVHLYSVHDDNVINQLIAYGVYEWHMIPYAAGLFVEILEVEADQYAVRIAMRNSSTDNMVQILTMPGCDTMCPFEQFKQLVEPYRLRLQDRDEACGKQYSIDHTDIIIVACVATIGIIIVIIFIVTATRRKTPNVTHATSERTPLKYGGFENSSS